jgi:hypothetical protein
MTHASAAFLSWFQNKELRDHIERVQTALDESHHSDAKPTGDSVYKFAPYSTSRPSASSSIAFDQLLERDAPDIGQPPSTLGASKKSQKYENPTNTDELQSLLQEFRRSQTSVFHRRYGCDLDRSRRSLDNDTKSIPRPNWASHPLKVFTYHRDQCRQHLQDVLASITKSLSPSNVAEEIMFTAGQWPRVTTRSLLGKLAFSSSIALTGTWKQVLITLAQALLGFQRSQRLLGLALVPNHEELYKELQNKGYDVQDGLHYPDWLLIQVRHNLLTKLFTVNLARI